MRLFTRTVHLNGPLADVIGYSSDMRDLVTAKAGLEVGLWNVQFGAPLGTLVYSARVEGLAHLTEIHATLMADADYHAMLARGADYMTPGAAEDALGVPLNGEVGDTPPVGTVATVTRAVVAGGKYAEALAWGVDIAAHTEKVSGFPVGFYMNAFGTFGSVAWISGAPDAAAAEAGMEAINADSGYMERLGDIGTLFMEGSGVQTLATRIA